MKIAATIAAAVCAAGLAGDISRFGGNRDISSGS